ncbi:substrate-binding domain-containing protein [Nocardioides sp.]|jgi:ABC-type phosphate transport system substrate-binding protein|uniref:substrate-binding domain-containing protein n=1 Tax=Nocardioides sp. TaxID=35761 RepID=UPI002C399A1A|nr:substrate-binding domain-containing protein [Nocardioides sp.]HVX54116.1 substrate-binding domain-containing protein [Nocardioides sp.]
MFTRKKRAGLGASLAAAAVVASGLALVSGSPASATTSVPTATADDAYVNSGYKFGDTLPENALVGMGSDTIQFVMGQLAAKYNEQLAAGTLPAAEQAANSTDTKVISLAACDPETLGAANSLGLTVGVAFNKPCVWQGQNSDNPMNLKDFEGSSGTPTTPLQNVTSANASALHQLGFTLPTSNGVTSGLTSNIALDGDSGSGAASLTKGDTSNTAEAPGTKGPYLSMAFSRASGTQPGKHLEGYPFALDSIVMVTSKNSNAPATLTPQEVWGIYTGVYTNWSQLGGKPGAIHALLPANPSSGTRKTFTTTMLKGWGGANPDAANGGTNLFGSDVSTTWTDGAGASHQVIEHDPTPVADDPNAIAPFSWGRVALTGNLVNVENGIRYDREVYNYFRTSAAPESAGVPSSWLAGSPLVESIFGENGWICSSDEAKQIIEANGMFPLASTATGGTCGAAADYTGDTNKKAVDAPVTTRTTVVVSGNTATALVQANSGTPTGSVVFSLANAATGGNQGAAPITVPLTNGQAVFQIPAGLPAGTYHVGAAYVPDSNAFETSSNGNTNLPSEDNRITVAGAGSTPVVTPTPTKTKAQLKLAKDKAALKKAKKAYKKAHGAKKAKLKKKIAKLTKAVKKDKKKVKAGK